MGSSRKLDDEAVVGEWTEEGWDARVARGRLQGRDVEKVELALF